MRISVPQPILSVLTKKSLNLKANQKTAKFGMYGWNHSQEAPQHNLSSPGSSGFQNTTPGLTLDQFQQSLPPIPTSHSLPAIPAFEGRWKTSGKWLELANQLNTEREANNRLLEKQGDFDAIEDEMFHVSSTDPIPPRAETLVPPHIPIDYALGRIIRESNENRAYVLQNCDPDTLDLTNPDSDAKWYMDLATDVLKDHAQIKAIVRDIDGKTGGTTVSEANKRAAQSESIYQATKNAAYDLGHGYNASLWTRRAQELTSNQTPQSLTHEGPMDVDMEDVGG